MPKLHRDRPATYETEAAAAVEEPVAAIVVDEHGDDAAAVADAPPAPRPGPAKTRKGGA